MEISAVREKADQICTLLQDLKNLIDETDKPEQFATKKFYYLKKGPCKFLKTVYHVYQANVFSGDLLSLSQTLNTSTESIRANIRRLNEVGYVSVKEDRKVGVYGRSVYEGCITLSGINYLESMKNK